jgi:hypothetical protein
MVDVQSIVGDAGVVVTSRVRGHGLQYIGLKYFESAMANTACWGLDRGNVQASGRQQDYWFSLRLRVDSPAQLWQAAALRCLSQADLSADEVEDLIGPLEDPSIADCLMVLALPERLPGCTRLDTALQPVAPDACAADAAPAPSGATLDRN